MGADQGEKTIGVFCKLLWVCVCGGGGGTVRLFMEAMQHQDDCVFSYLLVFKEKV